MTEFYGTEEDMVVPAQFTDDEAYILIAAVRYQLPRMTYGSAIICNYIEKNITRIPPLDVDLLIREIESAIKRNEVSSIDSYDWKRIVTVLRLYATSLTTN